MSDISNDTTVESTAPTEPPAERLSPKGMAAMQGESDGGWNTGRPAELAALEQIKQAQGSSIDLNSPADGGHKGFKIYDVAGPDTVASVKHLGQDDTGDLSEATLANYRFHFREAIGMGRDPAKFQAAAENLSQMAAKESNRLPAELRDNPTEYLKKHAEMWVPEDHAYQIKDSLRSRLHAEVPEAREAEANNYGLRADSETYAQDVADLLERIVPLPKTSRELANEFYQR